MFGDDRKWYDLRSNTNTRTQYEPARLQKDPPRSSDASGYVATQYARPRYSMPYTGSRYSTPYAGPGISKPYSGPVDPLLYAAPVNSRQFVDPANPTPYTGSVYSLPYTALVNSKPHGATANPTPYSGSGYSSSYVAAANPAPSTSGRYPSSYASSTNPTPYTSSAYSRPPKYPAPVKPMPYTDSEYPRQSSSPAPPPQRSRLGYSAQNQSSGKTADEALTDLIGQFSKTHLDQRPSTQGYRPALISAPSRQDAIDEVVQEVLTRDLKMLGNEKLLPTDPVFDHARQFARKWDISDQAVNSHIQLACGYLKFPVILLLNPAPTHESMPFDQMVNGCKTLRWIEDILHGIGLRLKDVIILDACTLLGSDRIKQLGTEGEQKKKEVIGEAYDVTQRMLRRIQPNIILSCQCSTSFSDWSAGGHLIARELCSSTGAAKKREVKKVYLNERTVNVIQAYHPSGFLNRKGHHDTFGDLLKGVFRTVYFPCGSWKSQHLLATLASPNTTITYRSFGE